MKAMLQERWTAWYGYNDQTDTASGRVRKVELPVIWTWTVDEWEQLHLQCQFIRSAVFLTTWIRPLVSSAYQKNVVVFYFSTKTYVVDTQKNHLNETVLLSTQNMLKLMGKKIFTILNESTQSMGRHRKSPR